MSTPDITHLIDRSDVGSWADILPFCINIKVSQGDGGQDAPSSLSADNCKQMTSEEVPA